MTHSAWREIVRHCLEERPNEACGLISGRNGYAETIWRMDNIEKSPVSFAMEPRQIQKALHKMSCRGETLVGIYHSHPTAPPYPSPEDIQYASYPEAAYLIVSLSSAQPLIGCYQIRGGRAIPLRFSIER